MRMNEDMGKALMERLGEKEFIYRYCSVVNGTNQVSRSPGVWAKLLMEDFGNSEAIQ